MSRTTLEFDDELFRAAKVHAAKEGMTLQGLFEKGLRNVLVGAGVNIPKEALKSQVMAAADEVGHEHALDILTREARKRRKSPITPHKGSRTI